MHYDVIIIGGGILGYSTAFQLQQKYPNLKIALFEKEAQPSLHQTGRNSGVIHAGIYYTPGSLKAKFCIAGNRASMMFCQKYNIPFQKPGKLIVATDELELIRMQELIRRCKKNGLDCTALSGQQTKQWQPGINAIGSIFVPDTGIVDWKQVTQKYAENFEKLGGNSYFKQKVVKIKENATNVVVYTADKNIYECGYLIACAGLFADRIVGMADIEPQFKIIPFRGEYYRLTDRYSQLFRHLIYPVPDPNLPFLGIHFTPQMTGFTTVGPNAVLALAREGYSWLKWNFQDAYEILSFKPTWKSVFKNFPATIDEFHSSISKFHYLKRVQKYYPMLQASDLIAHPAGIRAQAVDNSGNLIDDFMFVDTPRMLHVANAPSPAATSSLPIGQYIIEKFAEKLH